MLRQILALFNAAPGPLSLELLAAQLDVDRSALEGMLGELVALGRLTRTTGVAATGCTACGVKGACPYILTTDLVCYNLASVHRSATTQRDCFAADGSQ